MHDLFDRLDELAANDDLDAVEKVALEALEQGATDLDLWRYVAWVRFEQGRLPQALEAAIEADDPLYEAKAHFHLWDLDAAREALAECPSGGEDDAETEWYRGLCAEFSGEDGGPHFRRAAREAPDLFPEPVRLDDAAVAAVMEEAIRSLPPEIARVVAETVVEIRPLPQPHPDVDPLSFGLYLGVARLERRLEDTGELPSRIEIYRGNIERMAADRDEAVDELRVTLLHEIAHHLGYDEGGVVKLGLE
ncbi:MAG: metallopeptidase family protein [Planctomycetota bacterium]|jgi:predicted Zn-dependent protease with MMP-like domain